MYICIKKNPYFVSVLSITPITKISQTFFFCIYKILGKGEGQKKSNICIFLAVSCIYFVICHCQYYFLKII